MLSSVDNASTGSSSIDKRDLSLFNFPFRLLYLIISNIVDNAVITTPLDCR